MPILEIDIVGEVSPVARKRLGARLADVAGQVLRSPPGGTWVKVRLVAADLYGESGGGPPAGVSPVFVRVLARDPPEGDARKEQVRALARAVALTCGRAEQHVHVIYEPGARGRVAFGGVLVE